MAFVSKNIVYPEKAHANGIQGRVTVSFIVDKEGTIRDAEIVRNVDPDLDAEALRVINAMPKWVPGKQRGQKVLVKFNVPITFTLQ
jgi:protein TonB